jgi:hypothetical protein
MGKSRLCDRRSQEVEGVQEQIYGAFGTSEVLFLHFFRLFYPCDASILARKEGRERGKTMGAGMSEGEGVDP